MKKVRVIYFLALCVAALEYMPVAQCAPQEFIIPNFENEKPGCIVKPPDGLAQCTPQGCSIPWSEGQQRGRVQVSFSCLPGYAPTGFENPPSYVQLESIHFKNGNGEISLIDDIANPASNRRLELSFCLYGISGNLCGYADQPLTKSGTKSGAGKAIKKFIQGIELRDDMFDDGMNNATDRPASE